MRDPRFFILCCLALSSLLVHASHHANSPQEERAHFCSSLLKEERVIQLTENQVLMFGRLTHQWNSDSIGQPNWGVRDDATQSDYTLTRGDKIFVLDPEGNIEKVGLYSHEEEVKQVSGKLRTIVRPLLVKEDDPNMKILAAKDLERMFATEKRVVVIMNLTPLEKWLYEDEMAQAAANCSDEEFIGPRNESSGPDEDIVAIGSARIRKSKVETVLTGKLYYVFVEPEQAGIAPWIVPESSWIQYMLRSGEPQRLHNGDRIFLLDKEGQIFYETRLEPRHCRPLYPSELFQKIHKASSAVVFTPAKH